MKAKEIKAYIIEQQREYTHGSTAYNLLRKLETIIPNMIEEYSQLQTREVSDEKEKAHYFYHLGGVDAGSRILNSKFKADFEFRYNELKDKEECKHLSKTFNNDLGCDICDDCNIKV